MAPVFNFSNIIKPFISFYKFPIFLFDFLAYRLKSTVKAPLIDLYPCFFDSSSASQSGAGHYFYQDTWALARIAETRITHHVDVGSRIDGFVGQLSAFVNVEYVDIRPVDLKMPNLTMRPGSVLSLPYLDMSLASLSSLHVIEHVGLGRYGDPVDPECSYKAAKELQRVPAPGGKLFVGTPVGRERVAFNAHRIHFPQTVIDWFSDLTLVEFSIVDDKGVFTRFVDPTLYGEADYACGLFIFRRSE
jgi:hypothetical protein